MIGTATESDMLFGGFEVHIGNDPDYNSNAKCAGGPFLECNDCVTSHNSWAGGFEAECNLEGEYVSLVRDPDSADN